MTALNNETSLSLGAQLSDSLLLPQVTTAVIEKIINKALSLNTNDISFVAVAQKTLTLKLAELTFPLCFTVNTTTGDMEVIVGAQCDHSDCTIYTSISTLKKLKAQQSLTQLIKQDQLDVIGDIAIAQQFSSIAQSLNIDWQTELAKHIGDVATHKLLQLGGKISQSILATGKQLEADVGEYLVHEKRLVVTTSQIKTFNQAVTNVANQVDDLSTRINKIIASINDK